MDPQQDQVRPLPALTDRLVAHPLHTASNTIEFISAIPVRISENSQRRRRNVAYTRVNTRNLITICTNKKQIRKKETSSVPKPKSITLFYWNACSLKNKTTSIFDYIVDSDMDILTFVETWLFSEEGENSVFLNEMVPTGYSVCLCSRPDGRTGGGLCIIYKEELKLTVVDSSNRNKRYDQFEYLDCSIRLTSDPRSSIRLVLVYRPQPTIKNGLKVKKFWQNWSSFLHSFNDQYHDLVIAGDLNFHLDDPTHPHTKRFNSIIKSFSLKQNIKQPTFTSGHTLDVLITKSESGSIDTNVDIFDPGLSDNNGIVSTNHHYAVSWSLSYQKPKPTVRTITCRNLKRIDEQAFSNDLTNCNLEEKLLESESLDNMVEVFSKSIQSLIDKHAPLRTRQVIDRAASPWFTDKLQSMKQTKRRLERIWKKSRLEIDRVAYRKFCGVYNRCLHHTCITHSREEIQKCQKDRSKLSKICKSMIDDTRTAKISLPNCNNDADTASSFSKFFSHKVKEIQADLEEQAKLLPTASPINADPTFAPQFKLLHFKPTDTEEVEQIVNKSNNKTCNLDPLPTAIFRKYVKQLSLPLSIIINKSLSSGTVPTNYKTAIVTPVLKKAYLDPHQASNYRPISNLQFTSKILEKVVYKRLEEHFTRNELMSENQSAYRRHHSTETALLKVTNDILAALDQGKSTLLVVLDISAAFDTVNRQMLLQRYRTDFGISGAALEWIASYLTDRKQMIKVGSSCTIPTLVDSGFPQGSVLGGFKFNAYTSPLDPLVRQHCVQDQCYADDSNLYVSFNLRNDSDTDISLTNLTNCMSHVKQWMVQNRLQLNASKTEAIFFQPPSRGGLSSRTVTLLFDGHEIEFSKHIESLGVIIDDQLKLVRQVNAITKTAHFYLRKIKRVRNRLTQDIAETLVNTLITSRLDYCNALLCHLPKNTINKLQKVQNASAKVILQARKRAHVTPLLKRLHWLPISYRCQFKILTLTYKILSGTAPVYLKNLVSLYCPNRSLRSASQRFLKRSNLPRSKYGERAFSNLSPVLWNGLPSAIRMSESLNEFKSKLKSHFFIVHYGTHN